jgi:hypothetical protein
MTLSKRLAIMTLALATALTGLETGALLGIPGLQGFVSEAQAVVGRPLTPVSVAGVARRSVRRCAVGVSYC